MSTLLQNILILDVSIFSIILLFCFFKPRDINFFIGYRTARSIKNEKNWKFAQDFFPKKWLITIPIMLVTQIPILFGVNSEKIIIISGFQFIIISIYAIIVTEKALKKMDEKI